MEYAKSVPHMAHFEHEIASRNLRADIWKDGVSSMLNELLNSGGGDALVEEKGYQSVDRVFPFICASFNMATV